MKRLGKKRALGLSVVLLFVFVFSFGAAFDGCVTGVDEDGRPVIVDDAHMVTTVSTAASGDVMKIHWVPEQAGGAHASTQHHIDMLAEGFGDAWELLYEDWGYYPQADYDVWWPENGGGYWYTVCQSDDPRGGDGLVDAYVWNPNATFWNGRMHVDWTTDYQCRQTYAVFVRNNPLGVIAVSDPAKKDIVRKMTATHELGHVAQEVTNNGGRDGKAWREGFATMAANELYDIFNTVPEAADIMMHNTLAHPEWNVFDNIEYEPHRYFGYAPFFHYFLAEWFDDPTIIREIDEATNWPLHPVTNLNDAIVQVIEDRGEDPLHLLQVSKEWFYMSGAYDDQEHYEWCQGVGTSFHAREERVYPGAFWYPTEVVHVPQNPTLHTLKWGGGACYIVFDTNNGGDGTYTFRISGVSPDSNIGVSILRKNYGEMKWDLSLIEMERQQHTGSDTYDIPIVTWDWWDKTVVMVQNLTFESSPPLEFDFELIQPE